jgi:hypothetical protein
MKTCCPVCYEEATVYKDGRIQPHADSAGGPCPMSYHQNPPWDERSTRAAVPSRSGGICEFCRKRRASQMHHRVSRGVGGPWSPENILHLCHLCHGDATRQPDWAWGMGLICKTHENPGLRLVTREDGTQFQPTNEVTR